MTLSGADLCYNIIPIGFSAGVLSPVYLSMGLISDEFLEYVIFSRVSGVFLVRDCLLFIPSSFDRTVEVFC